MKQILQSFKTGKTELTELPVLTVKRAGIDTNLTTSPFGDSSLKGGE